MNKLFLLIVALVFCVLFPGCATTGDPNCVGLFCFSEEKAKARQGELKTALAQEEGKSDELRRERQDLEAKIAAKKREVATIEEKIATPPSDLSTAEVNRLRKRKEVLEKEIKDLEEDAKMLGM